MTADATTTPHRRAARRRAVAAWVAAGTACALVLAGCSASSEPDAQQPTSQSAPSTDGPGGPGASSTVRLLPEGALVDYQLGGPYDPPPGVTVVVRDVTATPSGAGYDLCYVNAFQTQPGDSEAWLADHPGLVLHVDGVPLEDPDWPGELVLDTSTAENRTAIAEILGEQVDACAAKGFDAVEPDNLDSFTRSAGLLSEDDNLALAGLLVERAHAAGLAIAQKNTVELGERGREAGFDLAVAEDCAVYDECGDYTAVYGRQVIEIVYDDAPDFEALLEASCADHGRGDHAISVVGRDRPLSLPGDPGYTFVTC